MMAHLTRGCRLGRCGLALINNHAQSCLRVTSQAAMSSNRFWEPDKKGGYNTKIKRPTKERLREGLSMLGTEVTKFAHETRVKFRADPVIGMDPGDYEYVWRFDKQEAIDQWIVTSDQDHKEGSSKAQFVMGKYKKGCFEGTLNTEVPKDGITKRAGYANIRSAKRMKSFQRHEPFDWSMFTHLILRVRGDGRPYQLVLHLDRYFDVQWNDQYHYTLFTHGGPYWQTAKIPFSKFYLTGKGRVQDKQETIRNELWRVSYLGITLADNSSGPFSLEIDYIGVMFDATHKEDFAYEMYETSPAALG